MRTHTPVTIRYRIKRHDYEDLLNWFKDPDTKHKITKELSAQNTLPAHLNYELIQQTMVALLKDIITLLDQKSAPTAFKEKYTPRQNNCDFVFLRFEIDKIKQPRHISQQSIHTKISKAKNLLTFLDRAFKDEIVMSFTPLDMPETSVTLPYTKHSKKNNDSAAPTITRSIKVIKINKKHFYPAQTQNSDSFSQPSRQSTCTPLPFLQPLTNPISAIAAQEPLSANRKNTSKVERK